MTDERRIAFWDANRMAGEEGAVKWLKGSRGELVIYTRGEYLEQLMHNILPLSQVTYFQGESVPPEAEEGE